MPNKTELNTWLTLLYASVSAKSIIAALKKVSSIEALLLLTIGELLSCGLTHPQIYKLKNPDITIIEKDLTWLSIHESSHVITLLDPRYPLLLLEIPDPPILLFVKGDAGLLNAPQLAIIGSRQASPQGKEIAFDYAQALANTGITITSGLALGIDAAAHRGALTTGKTVAVLGTGLAMVYPRQHLALAEQISQTGAVLSEFPPHSPPKAFHFPKRNRIISGLSLGVLVVEATLRSGSLITARLALEQGRDVFAIPGSIYNSMAKGCHELIRNGAKLVDTIHDITDELPELQLAINNFGKKLTENDSFAPKNTAKLDKTHQSLLDCIDDSPTSVETILQRSKLTGPEVAAMLLLLESEQLVSRLAGGYQKRGKWPC